MNNDYRVGFCVSSGGRLFRAAVVHAAKLGIAPALVVAEAKCSSDLPEFCALRRIPFYCLDARERRRFDDEIARLCIEARLDLLCLTFDRIVPPALVEYRGRLINVHMGLLPAFKGMDGLGQAVSFGARFVGASIHEVGREVDGGAVIAQCVMGVRRQDSAESIGRRLFGPLRLMFLQVLAWYVAGRVTRDDQGRIWIRDGVYGELPISPAPEDSFPD